MRQRIYEVRWGESVHMTKKITAVQSAGEMIWLWMSGDGLGKMRHWEWGRVKKAGGCKGGDLFITRWWR